MHFACMDIAPEPEVSLCRLQDLKAHVPVCMCIASTDAHLWTVAYTNSPHKPTVQIYKQPRLKIYHTPGLDIKTYARNKENGGQLF